MALTNKKGQTPAQMIQHDELNKQLAKIEETLEQLTKRTASAENKLNHTAMKIEQYGEKQMAAYYGYTRAVQAEGEKTRSSLWMYAAGSVIIGIVVQVMFFWTLTSNIDKTLQVMYSINEVLHGNAAYWYDADNHSLYTRDKENP